MIPNYTLSLTIDQINAVLVALSKLPYDQVAELIAEIRNQTMAQLPEKSEE